MPFDPPDDEMDFNDLQDELDKAIAAQPAPSKFDMRVPVLPIGQKYEGRYLVHEFIDHGAMGQIYRATDTAIDQDVALKFVYTGQCETRAARGFREFATARQVGERCVHILRIHDITSVPAGDLVLIMEMLDGENLRDWMMLNAPAEWQMVRDIALQVADGLKAMHRWDYIHRDIKPENLFGLQDEDGGDVPFIKIIDFGIVKDIEADALTATSMELGTKRYMPPELFHRQKISDRADIFSFGVVLFELLAGFNPLPPPSDYNALVEVYNSKIESVQSHCNAPTWFAQLVDACLSIEPRDRPSAVEFIAAVKAQRPFGEECLAGDSIEVIDDADIILDEDDPASALAHLDAALALEEAPLISAPQVPAVPAVPPPTPVKSAQDERRAPALKPVEVLQPPTSIAQPQPLDALNEGTAQPQPLDVLEEAIEQADPSIMDLHAGNSPNTGNPPAAVNALSAPFADDHQPPTYSLKPPSSGGSKGSALAIFGGLALVALAIVYVSSNNQDQPVAPPPPHIAATQPELDFKPRGPVNPDDFPSAPRAAVPSIATPSVPSTAVPSLATPAPITSSPPDAPTRTAKRSAKTTRRPARRRTSKPGVRNSFAALRDRAQGKAAAPPALGPDTKAPAPVPISGGLAVDEAARPLFFSKKKSKAPKGPGLPVGKTFPAKLEAGISSSMHATVIARLTQDVHVGDDLILSKGDVIRGRQGNDSTRIRIDFTEAIHNGVALKFKGHAISNGAPGLPATKKKIPKEERGTNVVARGALRTAGTVAGVLGGSVAGELAGNVANEGAAEVRPDFNNRVPFVLTVPKGTRFRVMVTGK